MTRDVVIKALECITDATGKPKHCYECEYDDKNSGLYTCMPIRVVLDALALLKDEPKRGRWQPNPYDRNWSFCSACGRGTELVVHEDGGMKFYNYGFCPWCGAKLEVDA